MFIKLHGLFVVHTHKKETHFLKQLPRLYVDASIWQAIHTNKCYPNICMITTDDSIKNSNAMETNPEITKKLLKILSHCSLYYNVNCQYEHRVSYKKWHIAFIYITLYTFTVLKKLHQVNTNVKKSKHFQ